MYKLEATYTQMGRNKLLYFHDQGYGGCKSTIKLPAYTIDENRSSEN